MCLLALLLGACNKIAPPPPSFKNTDLTGLDYARDFALTDHNGKPRTLADFRGKVVIMFFGLYPVPGRVSDHHGRTGGRHETAGTAG